MLDRFRVRVKTSQNIRVMEKRRNFKIDICPTSVSRLSSLSPIPTGDQKFVIFESLDQKFVSKMLFNWSAAPNKIFN